jgi:AraC family transcriptional regulator
MGVSDPALAKLLELCADEGENHGRTGRLYGDSLAHALICRFMRLAQMRSSGVERAVPLPKVRLRRVLDRIHTDFAEDLGLDDLATTSGYSRAHFLRMFRAATGMTPHGYLREVRLENARRLLAAAGAASIAEIALACGFSSHSHLTRQFSERFGVTPSAFRRSA